MTETLQPDAPRSADFAGQPCLVLGAARSGLAAARRLARWGARVTLYDREPARLEAAEPAWQTRTGGELPDFEAFQWVIQSPGVPVPSSPHIVPEVDLAAIEARAPFIGITGTNGKSTTTVLVGEMLRQSGLSVEVGGNLGTPLCDLDGTHAEWIVVELSSFQLEHARWLRPHVAVLLNLADDHFDRHGDLASYGAAKEQLVRLLDPAGVLVFNLDDAWATRSAQRARARTLGFSTLTRPERGAYRDGADLVLAPDGAPVLRLKLDEIGPSARAHPANVLAAALAAHAAGATPEGIRAALACFQGLPHRAQPVAHKCGVTWVDDSKATNPAAAIASLEGAVGPVVWLSGGLGKGLDFAPLARVAGRARLAIVFGRAAGELAGALSGHTEVIQVTTLEEAVGEAARRARSGDTVLLSPACASFDQFKNFEERGDRFAALVKELPC